MADSSGFGVGAVVMVVQAGGSVGKMMGMGGVGAGVEGDGVAQEVVIRIEERRKLVLSKVEGRKDRFRFMWDYW
jgi:hypothetical protein